MKVMAHCHLFPGGFGEEKRDEFGIPGTAGHLARFIGACGFGRAQVLAPHPPTGADATAIREPDERSNIEWLLEQQSVSADADSPLIPAAAIIPDRPGAADQLRRAISLGVRWLKIHPLIGRADTLAGACDPFYELADEARMPIVFHTGGKAWEWDGRFADTSACAQIAERFGRLPILMAHCGTFRNPVPDAFEAAVEHCRTHPNLYLDMTMALLPVGAERWKRALDRVGPAKVIYGTDYPWCSVESVGREMELIDSLGLGPAEKGLILGGSFLALDRAAREE